MKKFLRTFIMVVGWLSFGFVVLGGSLTLNPSLKVQALLPKGEQFAEEFFTKFNAGNFEAIYDNLTDGRFRLSQSKKDFVALLQAIQKKIGKVTTRARETSKWQSLSDGSYFEVTYSTIHENGSAVETLTLRKNNEKWLLVGYNVVSRELILR